MADKTVRVRMKTLSAGPLGARRPGDEVTVSLEEARQLVDGGYADALEPLGSSERAKDSSREKGTADKDESAKGGERETRKKG